MRYILIDTMNLFFRARHSAPRQADLLDKLGLSMHMMLSAANKVVNSSNIDHVVFCLEGGNNWRKGFYEPYKRQRAESRQKRTVDEVEEDDLYFEVYNEFVTYLQDKTNCSCIAANTAEADDVIARWIELHPTDEHVILSSDTDYYQLISDSVEQYNGITKERITLEGNFDDKGQIVIDKKTMLPKMIGDPKWLLFEKCIRGDKSDNVFSAYPGVRKKGTKKKTGLLEAFADKDKKGFDWNNLMMQHWTDHKGDDHKVLDDYERNRTMIDLSRQPDEVIDIVDRAIIDNVMIDSITTLQPKDVNFHFMKFCGKHDLVRLSEYPNDYIAWMSKPYTGHITELSVEDWKTWTKLKQSQ